MRRSTITLLPPQTPSLGSTTEQVLAKRWRSTTFQLRVLCDTTKTTLPRGYMEGSTGAILRWGLRPSSPTPSNSWPCMASEKARLFKWRLPKWFRPTRCCSPTWTKSLSHLQLSSSKQMAGAVWTCMMGIELSPPSTETPSGRELTLRQHCGK